ncbi:MAG TPA: (Fe-S)-binding protein [Anaerovoracaceae bacterium]|nr:(Fe-S)-binding protein [Anaerovoracaceae bacterium]
MALQDYRPMQERCSNCLSCKWIPFDKIKNQRFGENCPSSKYFNFNTYSARGRFQLGQVLLDEKSDYTDQAVEAIYSCTSCGMCDVACKITRYNLEPLENNIALKDSATEHGKAYPVQNEIVKTLKDEKTMIVGRKKANRLDWCKDLKLKDLTKETAEYMFFAGCKFGYELQDSAADAVKALQKAGVDLGIMGNADMCCAGRAQQMGFTADFEAQAKANIRAFQAAGVKTIVTPCSDCYYTFKRLYAKLGMNIAVLHVTELIAKLIQEDRIKFTKEIPLTVTYHDPCHLGRLGEPYVPWEGKEKKILNSVHTWEPRRPRYNGIYGVYDAPRKILESIPGIKLVEMDRIREYAWCCGAGGVCNEINPEFSEWTANERVTEANTTGADALVTACGWCEGNFSKAKDENGNLIKVYDIVDLVCQAL